MSESSRSRKLHELVAAKIAKNHALLFMAQNRLTQMEKSNPQGAGCHRQWRDLMRGPLPVLLEMLVEDSAQADKLRSESPFTTLITKEERNQICSPSLNGGAGSKSAARRRA